MVFFQNSASQCWVSEFCYCFFLPLSSKISPIDIYVQDSLPQIQITLQYEDKYQELIQYFCNNFSFLEDSLHLDHIYQLMDKLSLLNMFKENIYQSFYASAWSFPLLFFDCCVMVLNLTFLILFFPLFSLFRLLFSFLFGGGFFVFLFRFVLGCAQCLYYISSFLLSPLPAIQTFLVTQALALLI